MPLSELSKFEKPNTPCGENRVLIEGGWEALRELISRKLAPGFAVELIAGEAERRAWNARAVTAGYRLSTSNDDEGVRLVVGLGSAANALCAVKKGLERGCEAVAGISDEQTHMLSCVIRRADCVVDYSHLSGERSARLAGALGGVYARLVALFDYCFYGLCFGAEVNREYVETVFKICDSLSAAARGATDRGQIAAAVSKAGVRLCLADKYSGKSSVTGEGVKQCLAALRRLFSYEKRASKNCGENAFLFARALLRVYREGLEKGDACTDVPDNNRRCDRLEEYLNVTPAAAARCVKPLLPARDMARHAYIKNEYREELTALLDEAEARMEGAYRLFKRLSPDDGYGYGSYLDSSDYKTVISLAPDVGAGYSFLTELKNCGYLEKLLV